MSFKGISQEEMIRLLSKKEKRIKELERKVEFLKRFQKKDVPKAKLTTLVKQGKTNKQLSGIFKVSKRTIARRIKEYDLKGIRKPGRKTIIPKRKKPSGKWISVERYIDKLRGKYQFVNLQYPHTRYINEKTKVCSDTKANPQGSYTTAGVYYVAQNSGVHLIYRTRIRYSEESAPFDEIHAWIKGNARDILANSWLETPLTVVKIIGYTFINPQDKPEQITFERGVVNG